MKKHVVHSFNQLANRFPTLVPMVADTREALASREAEVRRIEAERQGREQCNHLML